jgi:hypothetical protein
MKTIRLFFCFLIVLTILYSCKKNDDATTSNISYVVTNNYNYKIILSTDNKVKEVVISNNNYINYKLTFQYFNKYFIQSIYNSSDNLILSKYYYLDDTNRVDSSIFFGINASNNSINDTTYSYYQYNRSILSEVDYNRYSFYLSSIGGGKFDTIYQKVSGFKSYEDSANLISSDMSGSKYYYSSIKNKLGLGIISFDQRQYGDFVFNVQYFGNQENNLINEIQHNGSKVNVTKFSYTIDFNGFINKIEKTYPQFDNTKYEIDYYKTVYNFSYSYE